jgi:hypothetical protein
VFPEALVEVWAFGYNRATRYRSLRKICVVVGPAMIDVETLALARLHACPGTCSRGCWLLVPAQGLSRYPAYTSTELPAAAQNLDGITRTCHPSSSFWLWHAPPEVTGCLTSPSPTLTVDQMNKYTA